MPVAAAASTSFLTMRPTPPPVPVMPSSDTLSSWAVLRASGDALTRPPLVVAAVAGVVVAAVAGVVAAAVATSCTPAGAAPAVCQFFTSSELMPSASSTMRHTVSPTAASSPLCRRMRARNPSSDTLSYDTMALSVSTLHHVSPGPTGPPNLHDPLRDLPLLHRRREGGHRDGCDGKAAKARHGAAQLLNRASAEHRCLDIDRNMLVCKSLYLRTPKRRCILVLGCSLSSVFIIFFNPSFVDCVFVCFFVLVVLLFQFFLLVVVVA
ncbi:hypothetical protein TraAM80_05814 [Trypanosoma rangeli]|uniref:Uncharacterized protein n=1 Tax=Trypanosoma rangeli TaxID=5698 RepID=A0A3R7MCL0_TRYRA|nr:uncharacterized protein TraAM80_05814 [Trypanosoma rangeli]RNF03368.1 hypothetical protein TraAM80_05814 [Trypanosoma rangeli]|eukprot:RNF03368.1 hypothetical protein TraAM80_05814 [Trypanosoma rangeli]